MAMKFAWETEAQYAQRQNKELADSTKSSKDAAAAKNWWFGKNSLFGKPGAEQAKQAKLTAAANTQAQAAQKQAQAQTEAFNRQQAEAEQQAQLAAQRNAAFDPNAYAREQAQLARQIATQNARGLGANASKAARLGGANLAQNTAGAMAQGYGIQSGLQGQALAGTQGVTASRAGMQNQLGGQGINYQGIGMQGQNQNTQNARADLNSAINTGANVAGTVASFMSDENAKTDMRSVDGIARAVSDKVSARMYKYKNRAHGDGEQVGVTAQDLERSPLKETVIDTPQGKVVDGGKLSGANTAMITDLQKQIDNITKYIRQVTR